MFTNLVPASSLFSLIAVLVLFTTHFLISFCVDDRQYQQDVACSELIQCGTIGGIGYPFSGLNRPAHCGHPGFQLTCQSGVPFLTIQNLTYRVLRIDTSLQVITVAREDLWDTNCPETLQNTTLDFNLFNHSLGNQNISLYYNCSSLPSNFSFLHQFNCTANQSSKGINMFTTIDTSLDIFNIFSCGGQLIVPVKQASASVSNLRAALTGGFDLLWTTDGTSCSECVRSGGRCGYNSINSAFVCYYLDQLHQERFNNRNGGGWSYKLKYAIGTALVLMVGISIVVIIYCCRSKYRAFFRLRPKNDNNIEAFITQYRFTTPKRYKYWEIKRMTNAFKDELGKGGFGSVFKGTLADGSLVAVKVLKNKSKGNGEDFINEVASIGRTCHVNIVALKGFCYEGPKRALVYEFMPNGSLEKFIFQNIPKDNEEQYLGVEKLYEIALGIARGLEYLHRGCTTRILHFDIKPHNILLDEEFCPKISDFGLAKLHYSKESIMSIVEARGTIGYTAPEVFNRNFGGVSHKSDVYSYGMMVLEMVGGRKNLDVGVERSSEIYFPQWIYKRLELDEDLQLLQQRPMTAVENEIARKMIIVGLWCIQADPSQRPSMNKVIEMLVGSSEALTIPPNPFFSSPPQPPTSSSTTLDSTTARDENLQIG